ncbi:MAG: hypothetical protein ACK5M8_19040 [Shewanella algae]
MAKTRTQTRAKLNKGELAGIRLVADAIVLAEVKKFFATHPAMTSKHIEALDKELAQASPKVCAATDELQKQITAVRASWKDSLELYEEERP